MAMRRNHGVRTFGSILFQQRGINPKVFKYTSSLSARISYGDMAPPCHSEGAWKWLQRTLEAYNTPLSRISCGLSKTFLMVLLIKKRIVLLRIFQVNEYIIEVNEHTNVQEIMENVIDPSLDDIGGICHGKTHIQIVKMSQRCFEGPVWGRWWHRGAVCKQCQ